DNSRPAGPPPTIAICVRVVLPGIEALILDPVAVADAANNCLNPMIPYQESIRVFSRGVGIGFRQTKCVRDWAQRRQTSSNRRRSPLRLRLPVASPQAAKVQQRMYHMMGQYRTALLPALISLCASISPIEADAISDFYRGKQISMVIGTSAGNDYDFRGRLIA